MTHSYTRTKSRQTGINLTGARQKATGAVINSLYFLFPHRMEKMLKNQFFAPRRRALNLALRKILATGTPFDLQVNDDTIRCWQWGQGPALIFVHGWGGIGLQFHTYIDKALAMGFSVILFDAPAHGLSPGKTCSYFQMTDAVRALLHRTDPVAGLIGHSFGAAAIVNALSKENLDLPAVLIAPALDLVQTLNRAFTSYGIPERIYMKPIHCFEKKYRYSFYDDNPINLLDDRRQTLFMIHDPQDRVIPYADSKKAAERYPGFSFLTVEGLGHKRIVSNPAVVDTALRFIENRINVKKKAG